MVWWQFLLFPFALLYDLVTRIRNYAFDTQVRKSFRFHTNVIAVGNLSVGGTGKTPMIDYLIDYFLNKEMNIATLSRGYGRRTSGFRLAEEKETPKTLGDEPYMYFFKHGERIRVAVGEERDLAIPELLWHEPDTQVILLDDAFQHREVLPSLNILLTTYHKPFYKDYLLPSGLLREARKGAERAEIILVTKCPSLLTGADQVKVKEEIKKYSKAKVFFTTVEYGAPKPFFENGIPLREQVVGISGIADPMLFNKYVSTSFKCKLIHNYKDHYHYSKRDVKDIINELGEGESLITTEKDMVKLRSFEQLQDFSCFYIPIKVKFLKEETLFLSMIDSSLNNDVQKPD